MPMPPQFLKKAAMKKMGSKEKPEGMAHEADPMDSKEDMGEMKGHKPLLMLKIAISHKMGKSKMTNPKGSPEVK